MGQALRVTGGLGLCACSLGQLAIPRGSWPPPGKGLCQAQPAGDQANAEPQPVATRALGTGSGRATAI
jgi:hypothetical protein